MRRCDDLERVPNRCFQFVLSIDVRSLAGESGGVSRELFLLSSADKRTFADKRELGLGQFTEFTL